MLEELKEELKKAYTMLDDFCAEQFLNRQGDNEDD